MKGGKSKRKLPAGRREELLGILGKRFEKNSDRHSGIRWADVEARLSEDGAGLWSINEMEETGGEPDVVWQEGKGGAFVFADCSAESPKERRSVCYDQEALDSRKEHKPKDSAVGMAEAMGVEMLGEDDYRRLQELGEFDLKTSSWVVTPEDIRKLGGALFCDRRFGHVFTYHNGAQSYYGARGFRGKVRV